MYHHISYNLTNEKFEHNLKTDYDKASQNFKKMLGLMTQRHNQIDINIKMENTNEKR